MALSDAEIKRLAQEAKSLEESAKGDDAIANLKEALRCYVKILKHCTDIAHYYTKRSDVNFRLVQCLGPAGDSYMTVAIADIDKAIELEPDRGDYFLRRGLYRLQRFRLQPETDLSREEANRIISDLQACISRDPSQPLAWLHLLLVNIVLGEWDEAISVYGQCKPYVNSQEHVLVRSYFGCVALAFAGDPIAEEDVEPLQNKGHCVEFHSLLEIASKPIHTRLKTLNNDITKERIDTLKVVHPVFWTGS